MTYSEIDQSKKGYIFELDDVLYPQKDYDLQVYYLFANFLEYQETFPPAADLTQFLKKVYENHGPERIFDKAKEVYAFPESYRENFERLQREAKLPLKLLMYQSILSLLQEMVVDRKAIYVVTSGNPVQQLNKIRQLEWNGLEKYLKAYFVDEINPKPSTDALMKLMEENGLSSAELLFIGRSASDEIFASAAGIDYLPVGNLF